jgi:hypothetical protein
MFRDNSNFLAKWGSPKHIERLSQSTNENDRLAVIRRNPHLHSKMMNDPSERVRQNIAYHTKDKAVLDHMVNDKSEFVRANVADKGHKDHLDKLVNDPDWSVRDKVAYHGGPEYHAKMVDDPHENIRARLASKGIGHDKYVHDKDSMVRGMVADIGSEEHKAILANDSNVNVRMTVAKRSEHPDTLKKLYKDSHPDVSRHALRHAADLGIDVRKE